MVTERAFRPGEVVQPVFGEKALGREHGVVPGHTMTFGKEEPVAFGVVEAPGGHVEHAVIENPEHIKGGESAGRVLLVPGDPPEERGNNLHGSSLQVKVRLNSRGL
ncbi:hypothetical protein Rhe02_98060 [Rhizocola hellebori]|uniref:Uncharacterized protein n=1 Tax=Rhizocola hellebori TaxID=1392758 RepID=A0A8J3VLV4_9ACTN|nr:hypothetical protein Rhe02_98060 [Rhizocola hellebori]